MSATLDPLGEADKNLREVQARYYQAYAAAVAEPDDNRAVRDLLGLYQVGSQGYKGMSQYIKTLASNGFAARMGPEGYYVVEGVDVTSVDDAALASVTACTFDDGVTYDTRRDGPDGKPILVDDAISSARTQFRYVREAGEWKLVGGEVLKSWSGENRCPAKS